MKLPVIPNWRDSWKWWSVRGTAAIIVWVSLPPETQGALVGMLGLPADKVPGILAALSLFGRYVQQSSSPPPDAP